MKTKILSFIFLSIFLISLVSAETMIVDAWFENDVYKTSAEINLGSTINFNAVFSSTGSPSTENILADSSLTIEEISCNQISSHTKNCTYKITPTNSGTFTITISGTDNSGDSDEAELTLTISSSTTNNAPTITSSPILTVIEGNLYSYQVTATDPEGNSLNYSLTQSPSWLSISTTGLLSGTAPEVTSHTPDTIIVSVSDGTNSVSQTYTLTVLDSSIPDTTAPTITLNGNPSITLELGENYTELGATATDDRDGNLTSQIIISSDLNTSLIGTYQVNYTVSDSAGNSANATRTIIVEDTTAPLIEIITPVNKTYSNDEIEVQVRITELDLQNCWYELNGEERTFACENGVNNFEIDAESGENELIIYANDSSGNENSTSIIFTYKKKSVSHGGGGSSTTKIVDPELTKKESSGNFAIPNTKSSVKENSYKELNFLYYLIISTASLGIILVSLILYRKLKPIKKPIKQNYTPTQNQSSPYY